MTSQVRVYVDPECPWCYITVNWMFQEVIPNRDVNVTMRPISLAMRNEGRNLDADYMAQKPYTQRLLRVLCAIDEKYGNDKMAEMYFALGKQIHTPNPEDKTLPSDIDVAAWLAAGNVDASLIDAYEDDAADAPVRAGTDEAAAIAGEDVGTPIIALERNPGEWVGYFGPVLSSVPRGDQALKLFDGLEALMSTEGFYELKRQRDKGRDLSSVIK